MKSVHTIGTHVHMYSPGGTIKYMWVVCCGRVLKLFALQVFDMLDGSKFIFFLLVPSYVIYNIPVPRTTCVPHLHSHSNFDSKKFFT